MWLLKAEKSPVILLSVCIITAPLLAQVKDTTQNQVQGTQATEKAPPAAATVQAQTPAPQLYPPAQQNPPAQQSASTGISTQVPQGAPSKSDYFSGKIDGELAGRSSSVSAGWFFLGCCGGTLGVVIPYVLEPDVSAEGILGKSNEYIVGFNDGYRSEVKKIRGKKALTGCIASGVAVIVYYVVMIAVVASSGG
jgi:hypothetical protein